ncbi:MAG: cob(I)yrinic acid a,c-diamide adenosyltransferase [Gammaproteobacteria bacterium]|jgi:cob(I)alamin adenosyltransferase|nr:ATP:cob(I)alamin adenosyltransferase [Chromatiales bacterium]MCP4926486.1 cob(I)yrinic acid a,c-diamide adenosyltransferase [Gammaproteobacteria bacterium]MDP7154699.1 cob(I)yrinic acid a,c-diamide adenosyltransferase [Gammaproteobacteria bacterium]MDP7297479.1 cob(I)yrinic acid a,c-diamide adenosyltransferase [Gammaproteobacteria bacterium]MDP7419820.1 cob(I)yrinic acid a,c-diamide adenosyltransferase [Gammaproteobacteria bacterium]
MGHRLTKIYTRTGDDGTTGLGDGQRALKDSARVEAFGTVDELNSVIGLLLAAENLQPEIRACMTRIQHQLFDLGGELCHPDTRTLTIDSVKALEATLDEFNADLTPLKDFVLPGGTPEAATCHLARTICRRAERRTWQLSRAEAVNKYSLQYLNRLSDLLFVIARVLNHHAQQNEQLWTPSSPAP